MSFRGIDPEFDLQRLPRPRARRRGRLSRRLLGLAQLVVGLIVLVLAFVIGVGYGRLTAHGGAGSQRVSLRVDRGVVPSPAATVGATHSSAHAARAAG